MAGRMTNSGQFERTLRELRRMGRVENVDAAAVHAARSMALALDEDPGKAAMWREYRAALRELTADDDSRSDLDALLAEISHEAAPGT